MSWSFWLYIWSFWQKRNCTAIDSINFLLHRRVCFFFLISFPSFCIWCHMVFFISLYVWWHRFLLLLLLLFIHCQLSGCWYRMVVNFIEYPAPSSVSLTPVWLVSGKSHSFPKSTIFVSSCLNVVPGVSVIMGTIVIIFLCISSSSVMRSWHFSIFTRYFSISVLSSDCRTATFIWRISLSFFITTISRITGWLW